MYNFDFSPLIWCMGAVAGGMVGLAIALLAWAVAPLGWWTFATPIVCALIGGAVVLRFAR